LTFRLDDREYDMNRLVAASIATLMALTPLVGAAQAQSQAAKDQTKVQETSPKPKAAEREWKKGGKYSGKGSRISNYRQHNLKAPPEGHRWVRDGNDFLLVAIGTGVIASIVNGR